MIQVVIVEKSSGDEVLCIEVADEGDVEALQQFVAGLGYEIYTEK